MAWCSWKVEGACLFERLHHRRIATVLESIDAPLLLAHRCLLGGGTAVALRYGEYCESLAVDFLVSDVAGYRELRQRPTGPKGLQALVHDGTSLQTLREQRADQYGLRTLLLVDDAQIKFEIVLEACTELDSPGPDDLVFSRDLIDLAMMQPRAGWSAAWPRSR